jgi:hypothetical protein
MKRIIQLVILVAVGFGMPSLYKRMLTIDRPLTSSRAVMEGRSENRGNVSPLEALPMLAAKQVQNVILQLGRENVKQAMTMQKEILANMPKSKSQVISEESQKVVMAARAEVRDFKAQYKKPEQCYNMKDNKTRIWCANDFIRARKAWEKQHVDNKS